MGKRSTRIAAIAIALTLGVACAGRDSGGPTTYTDPGIDDSKILIGSSVPFSGPASAYGTIAQAIQAYFKYVNEELGGVALNGVDGKKRTITFTALDDAYAPPRASENARRLVEQDKVFALFQTLGTANNIAIWDYSEAQKVPQVFVATGASAFGADTAKHSQTIGWQPAYPTESAAYAEYVKKEKPNGKVAILYQNDDYGKDYMNAFERSIAGSGVTIVARQSYQTSDPTVDSQVVNLAETNADVFFNITTPKFAAQAIRKAHEIGWDPLHLLNSVSNSIAAVIKPAGIEASQGIVTAQYLKDPSDPQWASDAAMMKYRQTIAKHGPKIVAENPFAVYGFAVAETLTKVLETIDNPTRQSLLDAVRNMKGIRTDLLLPGITINTSGDDGYPIESLQLARFDGSAFKLFGELLSFEGKTKSLLQ